MTRDQAPGPGDGAGLSRRAADERFLDHVDGAMSPREQQRFAAECRVNPQLQRDLDQYERTVAVAREALGEPAADAALTRRILAAVAAQPARPAAASTAVPAALPRSLQAWIASLVAAMALLAVAVSLDAWRAPDPGSASVVTMAMEPPHSGPGPDGPGPDGPPVSQADAAREAQPPVALTGGSLADQGMPPSPAPAVPEATATMVLRLEAELASAAEQTGLQQNYGPPEATSLQPPVGKPGSAAMPTPPAVPTEPGASPPAGAPGVVAGDPVLGRPAKPARVVPPTAPAGVPVRGQAEAPSPAGSAAAAARSLSSPDGQLVEDLAPEQMARSASGQPPELESARRRGRAGGAMQAPAAAADSSPASGAPGSPAAMTLLPGLTLTVDAAWLAQAPDQESVAVAHLRSLFDPASAAATVRKAVLPGSAKQAEVGADAAGRGGVPASRTAGAGDLPQTPWRPGLMVPLPELAPDPPAPTEADRNALPIERLWLLAGSKSEVAAVVRQLALGAREAAIDLQRGELAVPQAMLAGLSDLLRPAAAAGAAAPAAPEPEVRLLLRCRMLR